MTAHHLHLWSPVIVSFCGRPLTIIIVIINDKLTAADHETTLLTPCSSLFLVFYALRVLRTHGILAQSLHDVFRATVVAKILYCAPAWSGMCSAADRTRLNSLLSRAKRRNYCTDDTLCISIAQYGFTVCCSVLGVCVSVCVSVRVSVCVCGFPCFRFVYVYGPCAWYK